MKTNGDDSGPEGLSEPEGSDSTAGKEGQPHLTRLSWFLICLTCILALLFNTWLRRWLAPSMSPLLLIPLCIICAWAIGRIAFSIIHRLNTPGKVGGSAKREPNKHK